MSLPELSELAPSLYRLQIPGGQAHLLNSYLWLGDDGVTLFDTGWADSAGLISAALAEIGRGREDVIRVVLSHFHEDHAGSAAEIATWGSAEIVASAAEAEFVRGTVRGPVPELTEAERAIHPGFDKAPHAPPCEVNVTVHEGDELAFAGGARVIEVPGHTPGSIALYLPQVNAILTGDAVAEFQGDVILGVFNTDRKAAERALEKLAEIDAEIAGFGHGNPVLHDASRQIRTASNSIV